MSSFDRRCNLIPEMLLYNMSLYVQYPLPLHFHSPSFWGLLRMVPNHSFYNLLLVCFIYFLFVFSLFHFFNFNTVPVV